MAEELHSLGEVQKRLRPYMPLASKLLGKDLTLERMVPLMNLIGNPQKKLRVVHVAGTSGKTSTCYYIAGLLQASGQKVGLTISPHLDSLTERVQLNGRPLDEPLFCRELALFLDRIKQAQEPPTYFELLCAFALWEFARQGVDYAVVETGLGGLHDATNIIQNRDKVCVITDIGFDHMHVLGHTLAEIAAQKIGIAHRGNQVFMYEQGREVMTVIEQYVARQKAQLHIVTQAGEMQHYGRSITELPAYQQRNWLLAHHVYQFVQRRDTLPKATGAELARTRRKPVPGRMEAVTRRMKKIVMDGAHNGQKMQAFAASFRQQYPGVEPIIVVAFKQDKQYSEALPALTALASNFIVTTFQVDQGTPVRSADPRTVAAALLDAGAATTVVIPDSSAAYQAALAAPETTVVITGSLYLLSQVRKLVK